MFGWGFLKVKVRDPRSGSQKLHYKLLWGICCTLQCRCYYFLTNFVWGLQRLDHTDVAMLDSKSMGKISRSKENLWNLLSHTYVCTLFHALDMLLHLKKVKCHKLKLCHLFFSSDWKLDVSCNISELYSIWCEYSSTIHVHSHCCRI